MKHFRGAIALAETEAVALEERRWDDWLSHYHTDCIYWAPTWRADGQIADNPFTQMSHIYYDRRSALEDRVARFSDPASPAANPLPRTTHLLSCFRPLAGSMVGQVRLRANWVTHMYFVPDRTSHALFGHIDYVIASEDERPLILEKKVVLQNDQIPTMIDIYCM